MYKGHKWMSYVFAGKQKLKGIILSFNSLTINECTCNFI